MVFQPISLLDREVAETFFDIAQGQEEEVDSVSREIADILDITKAEVERSLARLVVARVLSAWGRPGQIVLTARGVGNVLSTPTINFGRVEASKAAIIASIKEGKGPRITDRNIGNFPELTIPDKGSRQ